MKVRFRNFKSYARQSDYHRTFTVLMCLDAFLSFVCKGVFVFSVPVPHSVLIMGCHLSVKQSECRKI